MFINNITSSAAITDGIESVVIKLLMWLDSLVYDFMTYLYQIYVALVKSNIFTNDTYKDMTKSIYSVLGVIMLFVLAYSLLKAVIDPDTMAKSEHSLPKIAQNVVVSLIIIAVLPTVFEVAVQIQNAFINRGTIETIISGSNSTNSKNETNKDGYTLAVNVYKAFLTTAQCSNGNNDNNNDSTNDCRSDIKVGDKTLEEIDNEVLDSGGFNKYTSFSSKVADNTLSFNFLFSFLGGIYLCYIILNFCFDMALRTVKLGFYQIIAPIAVVCRILPSGKFKDVFPKWCKQVISLFFEVFIRIASMTFGMYLIKELCDTKFLTYFENLSLGGTQSLIAKALLIMGIVTFIRQMPKVIGDLFGLDTGGMKLGLMDKLAAGGGLAAAATIGGAGGMLLRNGAMAIQNIGQANGLKNKGKALVSGIGSTIAGTASGGVRGLRGGLRAKNYRDVRDITGKSIAGATSARNRRAAFKYQHQGADALETAGNVVAAHLTDAYDSAKGWLGFGNNLSYLKEQDKLYKSIIDIDDDMDNKAADLLNRDSFANSSELTNKATKGEFTESYAVMKEIVSSLGDYDSSKNQAHAKLFKGGEINIRDAESYAKYKSQMQQQLNEAERKLKKYIKQQSYDGNFINAFKNVGIDIDTGSGEWQKAQSIFMGGQKLNNIYQANPGFAAQVNVDRTEPINNVSTYNLADTVVGVAKVNKINNSAIYEQELRKQEQKEESRKNDTKFVNSMIPPFGMGGRGPGGFGGPGGPGGPSGPGGPGGPGGPTGGNNSGGSSNAGPQP